MKNQALSINLFIFSILITAIISTRYSTKFNSNESEKTEAAPSDYDLTVLRQWRYQITPNNVVIRINEQNEISCLSPDNNQCYQFSSDANYKILKTTGISAAFNADDVKNSIKTNRELSCGEEHKVKYANPPQPYELNNFWCNSGKKETYDQWLCNDRSGLNIAIWIEFTSKTMFCASLNGKTCTSYNLENCKKLDTTLGVAKIPMGYHNSLTGASPKTVEGKIFIYQDIFKLDETKLLSIVQTPPTNFYDVFNVENYVIANFVAPRDLSLLKFRISTPPIGNYKGVDSKYSKLKLILKIDEAVIGIQEIIDPSRNLKKRSLNFDGVYQNVSKGAHKISFDIASYGTNSASSGTYFVYLEGY